MVAFMEARVRTPPVVSIFENRSWRLVVVLKKKPVHQGVGSCPSPSCASTSRFTAMSPTSFSPRVNRLVSHQCRVNVSAAPRSQRFGDPMRRNVGSADTRTASLRSS